MIRRSRTSIAKVDRSPAAIVRAVTAQVAEIAAGAVDVPVVVVADVADAAAVMVEAAAVDDTRARLRASA